MRQQNLKTLHFADAVKLRKPNAFSVMAKPVGSICNLNCKYCYYLEKKKLFPKNEKFVLSENLLEEFIKKYIESQDIPLVSFVWQGGEPTLLGIDYFKKAVELQKKYSNGKEISNAFQTNGVNINDEWCRFFADNGFLAGISIDGEEHNHDHYRKTQTGAPTFKKVIKAIEAFHKYKVEFNTLSVVNSYNVRFASETYRFLKRIGSGFIQFLPAVDRLATSAAPTELNIVSPTFSGDAIVADWSVGAEEFGKFLITIFDEWVRNDVARYFVQIFDATLANYVGAPPVICSLSETCGDALVIEHNGDIFSCDHYVYPEYKLGNINDNSFAEMAKSQTQFCFGLNKRSGLPEYCRRCEVLYACRGECPKRRFIKTPEGESGLNYLCKGYKMFFKHIEPYMEFMARELDNKRSPANVMTWIKNKDNQVVKNKTPDRNDPCPCGSGKKFKNCCIRKPFFNF